MLGRYIQDLINDKNWAGKIKYFLKEQAKR